MKKIYFILMASMFAVALSGCTEKGNEETEDPTLSINPNTTTVNFTTEAATPYSFNVETNQESWDVAAPTDATWCIVTKGTDNTFEISAEPNLSQDQRGPVTVTVTAGEATPIEITVTQDGSIPVMDVTPAERDITFLAGAAELFAYEVATNLPEWEVTPSEDWIIVDKDDNGFTVGAEIYSGAAARTGTVTVSAEGVDGVVINVTQKEMEIYVLAYAYASGSSGNSDAVYWKNGEKFVMATGSGYAPAAMWVHGDDVHAIGRIGGAASQMMYFKNNEPPYDVTGTVGSSINSSGTDIMFDGDDMYFVGYEGPKTIYPEDLKQTTWVLQYKNMERTEISEHLGFATSSAMDIHDGDIYIAGKVTRESGDPDMVYWKNGQENIIAPGDGWGGTTDIKVVDGKVYAGGYTTNLTTYFYEAFWYDGTMHRLDVMDGNDMIYGMDVDAEGNVYLAGATGGTGWARKAMYTKNGQMFVLTQGDNLNAVSSAVKVWGEDVYVIATQYNNATDRISVGKLYKNGEEIMEFTNTGSVWVQDLFIR